MGNKVACVSGVLPPTAFNYTPQKPALTGSMSTARVGVGCVSMQVKNRSDQVSSFLVGKDTPNFRCSRPALLAGGHFVSTDCQIFKRYRNYVKNVWIL